MVCAQILPLTRGMTVHSVSLPHMDHAVGYCLVLCPPTLLVGPGSPSFHETGPFTVFGYLFHNCLLSQSGVNNLYFYLCSTFSFCVRIFVVMAGPTSMMDPR